MGSKKRLNLYLLSQTVNNGYDTYDSCVVAAPSEEEARTIRPSSHSEWGDERAHSWARFPEEVKVTLIGLAEENVPEGVVLASFNAG